MRRMSRFVWGVSVSVWVWSSVVHAEITLHCEPQSGKIGAEPTVEVTCSIISTTEIRLRAVQLDLPCMLPSESGAMGAVVVRSAEVDLMHQDPPFLFGPNGIGLYNALSCQLGTTLAIGGQPALLPANQPRYLGTVIYERDSCDGAFRLELEDYRQPPTESDGTKVRDGNRQLITFDAPVSRISCTPADCPAIDAVTAEPPDGAVDARQPHPIDDDGLEALQGLGSSDQPVFLSLGVSDKPIECLTTCETARPDGSENNEVTSLSPIKEGVFQVELLRPISSSALTALYYMDERIVEYVAHPGNFNGDEVADAADVLSLVAYLDGTEEPPWGLLSADADRDGAPHPADLLRAVDLLAGADRFTPAAGTLRPELEPCP